MKVGLFGNVKRKRGVGGEKVGQEKRTRCEGELEKVKARVPKSKGGKAWLVLRKVGVTVGLGKWADS